MSSSVWNSAMPAAKPSSARELRALTTFGIGQVRNRVLRERAHRRAEAQDGVLLLRSRRAERIDRVFEAAGVAHR